MNILEQVLNTTANYYWGLKKSSVATSAQKKLARLIAHRGVHENGVAIENTLSAFDLAVANKIWGVELDIRFTSDHVAVIHHDDHLGRIFKAPDYKISQLTFADLRRKFNLIPTLAEVVERYGQKIQLLLEVKEPSTAVLRAHDILHLEKSLQPLKPRLNYHLLTLKPSLYENITFIDKKAVMCVDWMNMDETLNQTLKYGYGAISGHFLLLNQARLATSKQNQLLTGTGFIETRGALEHELSRGIDWIFTNHPLRLKKYLES